MTALKFEYLPKGIEGDNYETHHKIRIYEKDDNGYWQESSEPTQIVTKTLHGAKIKANALACSLGLVPCTRQWRHKMTFVNRPRAARFYHNDAGSLRMIVIGDATIIRTGGQPKVVKRIVNPEEEFVTYLGLWKVYARDLFPTFKLRPIGNLTAETRFHSDLNAPDLRKAVTEATEKYNIDFTTSTADLDRFIKACQSDCFQRNILTIGRSHKAKFQWYLTNEIHSTPDHPDWIGLVPLQKSITE